MHVCHVNYTVPLIAHEPLSLEDDNINTILVKPSKFTFYYILMFSSRYPWVEKISRSPESIKWHLLWLQTIAVPCSFVVTCRLSSYNNFFRTFTKFRIVYIAQYRKQTGRFQDLWNRCSCVRAWAYWMNREHAFS